MNNCPRCKEGGPCPECPPPSGYTIEYRTDLRQWEVKQGLAHRGLCKTEEQAKALVRELNS